MKLFILSLIALAGCSKVHQTAESLGVVDPPILCENKPFTDDDLSLAALDIIYPEVHHFQENASDATPAMITASRTKLASLRTFAKSISSKRVQAAYLYWIDYYDGKTNEAEVIMKQRDAGKPTPETDYDVRERERLAEEQRANELVKCLPRP